MLVSEILKKYTNIAVYGMSASSGKTANSVPLMMRENGFVIFPINPVADEIEGLKVNKKLMDVEGEIQILNVFRPSDQCLAVVEEAIERKKAKGDIAVIWLQEGIENDEAKALAEANNIEFVQDRCIWKDYFNFAG